MPLARTTAGVVVLGVVVAGAVATAVAAGMVERPLPEPALVGALFGEHAAMPNVASKARPANVPRPIMNLRIAPPAEKSGHLAA
jgi:hypothetical protein